MQRVMSWRSWLLFMTAMPVVLCIGCGPSKEELMMQAARRTRPKSADEREEQPKPAEKPEQWSVAESAPASPTSKRGDSQRVEDPPKEDSPSSESTTEVAVVASVGVIKPIEERKPATPLDESQRNQKAVENLNRLAEAFLAFKEDKGYYPPSAHVKAGIKTLSWRVLILPYLGHQDLFERFDLNLPWNRSPNKELLAFIPDVYVSPERFDEKTNWMVPADRKYMFGENRYPKDRNIDDGIDNTLMLVEVNDERAVEWTRPNDFSPEDPNRVKEWVGGLRSGGTLAAWANGWPAFIAKSASAKQWQNALTHESGDGQRAGAVHKEPDALLASSSASPSVQPDVAKVAESVESSARVGASVSAVEEVTIENRLKLPPSIDIAAAEEKVEQLFQKRVLQAKQNQTLAQLSKELLDQSLSMSDDAAGAYALQSLAIDLAMDSEDYTLFQTVLDQHASTFEVELYQLNRDALLEFARRVDLEEEASEQLAFTRRALLAIRDGLQSNDFDGVTKLASAIPPISESRRGFRRTGPAGQATTASPEKLVRLLQKQLLAANKQYQQAAGKVSEFRDNPSDATLASAFGRFYCFLKGDWEMGLPLVAAGASEKLARVAKRDLSGASDAGDAMMLGDLWWELSEGLPPGIYRQGTRDRAGHWYEQALNEMPESLDRLHVQARVKEWNSQDPGSPLATIRSLNRRLGLNEAVGLEQVVAKKQTQANAPGDDYEDG